MGLFIALLLIPILLQHIAIKEGAVNYEKKNQRALAFFFILLTVMLMLRHETVGNDTQNYLHLFNDIAKLPWGRLKEYDLEFGYVCLNKFVSLFTQNPQVFLAITALLGSLMLYPTFKRLCVDPSLTVALFCVMSTFYMMFSGIRQMLAISIGFIAYELTRQKKFIPFLLAVALALTFHTSAFMLLFMYPLYHARITKNWLVAVIPAMGLLFVFNEPVFAFLLRYAEQYTDKYGTDISQTGAYTMILLFLIFVVFAYLIPDESKLDQETVGLRNFLLLALALQMFAPLHTLAMRMNYYYIIFVPLLMPKIIKARSHRWKNVAIWGKNVMTVFFILYFFINLSAESALHVYPYHFFWESVV